MSKSLLKSNPKKQFAVGMSSYLFGLTMGLGTKASMYND